jgi:uncharacterized protein YqeY
MVRKEDLQSELQDAIRSGDSLKKDTLRLALSAIKLVEVEKRGSLDEGGILSVLQKEAKVRHESIEEAKIAGREDLLDDLHASLRIIESYLPQPLTEEELIQLAQEAISETGAESPKEMGQVMKVLMPRIQGRADGKMVSGIVRSLLQAN